MTTMLARRLEKLETSARAETQQRWREALRCLHQSMAPEHVATFRDWMHKHCGGQTLPTQSGETWPALLTRLQPPALVHAVWVLMAEHMASGAPAVLLPEVAEVYLNDPDAWPANPCAGCRYLLPTRSTIRPDGRYHHITVYEGECPVCGRDTHAQEDSNP